MYANIYFLVFLQKIYICIHVKKAMVLKSHSNSTVQLCYFLQKYLSVYVIFVILFDWFPIDDLSAWAGFALSFAACTAASVAISRLKEKTENKKMEQALGRMQK